MYKLSYFDTKSLGDFVGGCFVKTRLFKKDVPAKIYKVGNDNLSRYTMVSNDKILGTMELDKYDGDIFVSLLESYKRKKYKGIGTNLLQLAVEESLKAGNKGTVTLNAKKLHLFQKTPTKFYEKLNFEKLKTDFCYVYVYGQPKKLQAYKSDFWFSRLLNNKLLK